MIRISGKICYPLTLGALATAAIIKLYPHDVKYTETQVAQMHILTADEFKHVKDSVDKLPITLRKNAWTNIASKIW